MNGEGIMVLIMPYPCVASAPSASSATGGANTMSTIFGLNRTSEPLPVIVD